MVVDVGENVTFQWGGSVKTGRVYAVNKELRTVSLENHEGHLFINVMQEHVYKNYSSTPIARAVRYRIARMKNEGAPL